MIIPYSESQKALLVEEVGHLSLELNRPVSSKDLLARWEAHPESRPALLQSPGQLLLKAARPLKGDNPVLSQVGIIGNLAFYAEDDSPHWRERFRLHELRSRALRHVKWNIPTQALFLLGTEHENLARNALAGFVAEWETDKDSETIPETFAPIWEIGISNAVCSFVPRCPILAPREAAATIVLNEVERRQPFFEGGLNINRHLVRLAWPLSTLFQLRGFWPDQVRHYCAFLWPEEDEDPLTEKALWLCGVYGEPCTSPEPVNVGMDTEIVRHQALLGD